MKVFDTFLFYNELELLDLRLNTLDKFVDYFVITEAKVTFSGLPKPLYFSENRERYRKFDQKIIHNVIETTPTDFNLFSPTYSEYFTNRYTSYPHKSSGIPLSKLSLDFQREVFQRDSVINGLICNAKPTDLIMISDLDEIPNPEVVKQITESFIPGTIYNLCQKWYMYYFNVDCGVEWFGTRICDYATLKGRSIDLMRYHLEDRLMQPGPIVENAGWHFSFLGGQQRIREKLTAYSYQGRRSKFILEILDKIFPNRIQNKIEKNKDIFNTGRTFQTVQIDNSFPIYLLENKNKFKALIKQC